MATHKRSIEDRYPITPSLLLRTSETRIISFSWPCDWKRNIHTQRILTWSSLRVEISYLLCCSRKREKAKCRPVKGNSGNVCLWNPESLDLESEIQRKETGIPITNGIQNSAPTGKNWYLVSGICNPRCGIQNPRLSWIPLHGARSGIDEIVCRRLSDEST